MRVEWNSDEDECFVNERIGNQTLHMAFQMTEWTTDTIHFNIYLTLYNKRGQIVSNENEVKSTGLDPVKTFFVARRAFWALLNEVFYQFNDRYDLIVYCNWLDNRRREVYYKFLAPLGFRYGRDIFGEKCIFKRYKKGTAIA